MEEISVLIDALKTINPILGAAVAVAVGLSWYILHWVLDYFQSQLEKERNFFKTQLKEERDSYELQLNQDRKMFENALKEVCQAFNKEVTACHTERLNLYEQVLELVRGSTHVTTR